MDTKFQRCPGGRLVLKGHSSHSKNPGILEMAIITMGRQLRRAAAVKWRHPTFKRQTDCCRGKRWKRPFVGAQRFMTGFKMSNTEDFTLLEFSVALL